MKRVFLFPVFSLVFGMVAAASLQAQDFKVGAQLVYSHPVISLETVGPVIEFAPSSVARPGIDVRYRNYGVSFSTSPSFSTGLADARTFYHGDDWGFEAYHRYVRGFYAQSDESGSDQETSHPDMTLRSTSVTVFRAMGSDSRVYRLSDGLSSPGIEPDILMTFGLSQNLLRDDVPFLQGNSVPDSRFAGLKNLDIYSATVGAGMVLSTNKAGLYFDPAIFGGFGFQFRRWDGSSQTSWNILTVNLRMRMGYRGRWFDVGGGFENDGNVAIDGRESATFNALVARTQVQVYF